MKRLTALLAGILLLALHAGLAPAADGAQPTVLITGSNRGIGFEFVRQYADLGYRVIATCRNPDDADELNALAATRSNVIVERLDLVDLQGIDALAGKYAGQSIDVLINNAALMRGPDKGQSFGTMDYEMFDTFYHTNVRGPLKVAEAFWPNVRASQNGLVASLTTLPGEAGIPVPGFAYYKSSKAAIDNLHYDIGRRGKKDGVRVVTLMPGRVPTHGGPLRPGMVAVDDSVTGMISVMNDFSIDRNGEIVNWKGEKYTGE